MKETGLITEQKKSRRSDTCILLLDSGYLTISFGAPKKLSKQMSFVDKIINRF
jgi:hypothetical protein